MVPGLNVQGAFTGGGAQIGRTIDTENHYELQNYTSVASGAHSWKFGVRVRAVTINNISPTNFGGTFIFAGGYGPYSRGDTCNQTVPDAEFADCMTLLPSSVISMRCARTCLEECPSQFTISDREPAGERQPGGCRSLRGRRLAGEAQSYSQPGLALRNANQYSRLARLGAALRICLGAGTEQEQSASQNGFPRRIRHVL